MCSPYCNRLSLDLGISVHCGYSCIIWMEYEAFSKSFVNIYKTTKLHSVRSHSHMCKDLRFYCQTLINSPSFRYEATPVNTVHYHTVRGALRFARFIWGTGILAGESSCDSGSFLSCLSPWRKQSQGCNTCILEDRAMYRQDTPCLSYCHCYCYWLVLRACGRPLRTDGEGGVTVSESGNVKIDSTVGTRDELFVLVYFSGKFRSAIEHDVALLLPEPLLVAVE